MSDVNDVFSATCKLRLSVDNPDDRDFDISRRELADLLSYLNSLRAENARLVGEVAEARNLVGILRGSIHAHKDALVAARVAFGSSAAAWKKMADGLDRVKSEGEISVELGCEVAATFRLHQCGCEHALTTINEVLGEK